ncbi:hypothetical protein DFH11DRAFT_1563387 [Phellopilus nigrolimitatus]|nr:hypothetical protein DFH11DRAFT_1563387 [Phellopilus nigrolimitatus]
MHYPASFGPQRHEKEASAVFNFYHSILTVSSKQMITGVKQVTLPERVVVFRDGVFDGQFKCMVTLEHPEIRAAFCSFKGFSPKFAIAICRKRHRTCFYPMRPEQAD